MLAHPCPLFPPPAVNVRQHFDNLTLTPPLLYACVTPPFRTMVRRSTYSHERQRYIGNSTLISDHMQSKADRGCSTWASMLVLLRHYKVLRMLWKRGAWRYTDRDAYVEQHVVGWMRTSQHEMPCRCLAT